MRSRRASVGAPELNGTVQGYEDNGLEPDEEDEDEDEDAFEDAEDEGDADEEPLLPGTYRALYAFEPEGTAEMALEEEQVVRVVGRGGGVGWAVVEKEGAPGGHALVPESYLELVEAD